MRAVLAAGLALAALSGCGPDEVRIIGACEIEEVSRLVAQEPGGPALGWPSAGVLDSMVLVSWTSSPPSWQRGQWFDRSLAPVTDPFAFGTTRFGFRPRWVEWQGKLAGQLWADPEGRLPPPPDYQMLNVFWLPAGQPPDTRPRHIDVPLYDWRCDRFDCMTVGGGSYSAGSQALLPTAVVDDELIGMTIGSPAECGLVVGGRLHLFQMDERPLERSAQPVLWGDDPCDPDDFELEVGNPWPLPSSDGTWKVLVRAGLADDGRLRLLHIARDRTLLEPPRVVGPRPESTIDGGFQPRAVAVPGHHILFTDRRDSENRCHALRVMKEDGSNAHDAPWQLPCMDGGVQTSSVELVAVPQGAVLVWSERTRLDGLRITAGTRYQERIRAVLLTPEGQRGSPIVTVTPPESTVLDDVPRTESLGPIPHDYLVSAASENDTVAVTWWDQRVDAPGIWVRRLRCTVDR